MRCFGRLDEHRFFGFTLFHGGLGLGDRLLGRGDRRFCPLNDGGGRDDEADPPSERVLGFLQLTLGVAGLIAGFGCGPLGLFILPLRVAPLRNGLGERGLGRLLGGARLCEPLLGRFAGVGKIFVILLFLGGLLRLLGSGHRLFHHFVGLAGRFLGHVLRLGRHLKSGCGIRGFLFSRGEGVGRLRGGVGFVLDRLLIRRFRLVRVFEGGRLELERLLRLPQFFLAILDAALGVVDVRLAVRKRLRGSRILFEFGDHRAVVWIPELSDPVGPDRYDPFAVRANGDRGDRPTVIELANHVAAGHFPDAHSPIFASRKQPLAGWRQGCERCDRFAMTL